MYICIYKDIEYENNIYETVCRFSITRCCAVSLQTLTLEFTNWVVFVKSFQLITILLTYCWMPTELITLRLLCMYTGIPHKSLTPQISALHPSAWHNWYLVDSGILALRGHTFLGHTVPCWSCPKTCWAGLETLSSVFTSLQNLQVYVNDLPLSVGTTS